MNFCGNCGQKLNEGAKFCPNCGKNLFNTNQPISVKPEESQKAQEIHNSSRQPVQTKVPEINKKKTKSGKGILLKLILAVVILAAGSFFVYKFFLSGPEKLTAHYKEPGEKFLVKLDSSGMAPANMFGVMLKDGFGKGDAEDIAEMVNGKVVGEIELNNIYQIEFDGKTKEDLYSALEKVKSSDKVDVAFPDGIMKMDGAENSSCNPLDDPFYDGKDGEPYKMINLKQAWDIIKASGVKLNDVTIGVVDTDVNYESDELNTGKSLIVPIDEKDKNEKAALTHGTMVTEIIAGNGENGGLTGVASILGENLQVNTTAGSNLSLIPLNKDKADPENISEFEYYGNIYAMESMKNIQKQIDNGATIINCSFGNHWKDYTLAQHKDFSKVFKSFLERTQKKYPNVIIVGSAGNDSKIVEGTRIWSHKVDNLITAGAVNRDGTWANYSNVAKKNSDDEVTVVTCGENKMEDGKSHFGTSFSAPQITGIIALMRSINPKLTPAEIKKILTETSKKVEEKDADMKEYNQQLLQADDAVLRAIESATGKKWDKQKLLGMANVDLKSEGASPEFKITATIGSVGEKGTTLAIECTGGDYALGGSSNKELSTAGTVTWSLSIPNPETKISVRVTRLDTKSCKVILVGGKLKAEDLVGFWDGGVCWDSWSTPYKVAEPEIKKNLKSAKGEFLPMTLTMSLISENSLFGKMTVNTGGNPPPTLTFSFDDGNLEATTSDMHNTYHYSGRVKVENGKYVIDGEWSSSNQAMKMNGRWKVTKPIK